MTTARLWNRPLRKPPLLLLHGITCSGSVWRRVVPFLEPSHSVNAFTALGHRGGVACTQRPARVAHIVDDVERFLDENALEAVHVAGNSLGGWVALELARRKRALSVCALSPAGTWDALPRGARTLLWLATSTRLSRPLLPLLTRSKAFRHWALRDNAQHGERVTADEFMDLADDMLGCTVTTDLLSGSELLEPFSTLSCPVTLAWSEHDRILPREDLAPIACQRLPGARYVVLPDVGHVPMMDDPQLVADTILATTALVDGVRPANTAPAGSRL